MATTLPRSLVATAALCLLVAFALIAGASRPAFAAGVVVNSSADNTTPGDSLCTLREAIIAVQGTDNDCGTGVTGQMITFSASVTSISLAPQTVGNPNSAELPNITGTVIIDGGGTVTVNAGGSRTNSAPPTNDNPTSRVLTVTSTGNLTVEDISLINGYPTFVSGDKTTYNGGIIWNNGGTLTVTDSTLSGGNLHYDTLSGIGNGGAIFSGSDDGLALGPGGTLHVSGSTFTNNTAGNDNGLAYPNDIQGGVGGAISAKNATTTIDSSTFTDNTSFNSSGAVDPNKGTMTITSSTFTGNSSVAGGAIAPLNNVSMLISGSTFIGNQSARGGALSPIGTGTTTVVNSTFSGNSSTGEGGAIYKFFGTLTVLNSTVVNNTGGPLYGSPTPTTLPAGGIGMRSGSITVKNTIVAGNTANSGTASDCGPGTWIGTNNLSGDATCPVGGGFAQSNTINLGTIGAHGGVTDTILPLPGSSAIDAGNPATCSDATTVNNLDQRGFARPFDGNGDGIAVCDIGAVEIVQSDIGAPISASIVPSPPQFQAPATLDTSGLPAGATGTITYKAGDGTVICTAYLPETSCTSDPNLPVGTTFTGVRAYYSGDATHYAQVSVNSFDFTVVKADTTTTASAAYYDWAPVPTVAITATVAHALPSGYGPYDEGTVSFYNGGTLLCTVPLDDGQALCVSPITPSGVSPHSLRVVYGGSDNFNGSSTTTDVVPAHPQPTIVSVTQVFPDNGTAWLLKGGGFSGGSSVTVCGVAVPFTVINDNLVLIGVPPVTGPQQCTITLTAAGGTGSLPGMVTVVPKPQPGAPVVIYPVGPVTPPPPTQPTCGPTVDITLSGLWTLAAWPGATTTSVADALSGGDCGNDITSKVAVVWGLDAATQTYHAYFPAHMDVPGANDLSTLTQGLGYWVALNDPSTPVTWTIETA